jgi:HD-GYP domain-containing protein (c-di-GMP phosphodiesterase class II)
LPPKKRKETVLLVKVNMEQLNACPVAEYDLYTAGGELAFSAGYVFSRDELEEIARQRLYRDDQDLPGLDCFNHEGHLFRFEAGLTPAERLELKQEAAAESVLNKELTGSCLSSVTHFWNRLKKGATPDIALCEVVRDRMISEVTSQVEQIQYLSQIRVRDEFTYSHILDVTALSIALALKAGFSKKEIQEIALAAILHDLGKLLIPKAIMFKPTRLTEREFQVMQLHPGFGYKMITETLRLSEDIARPALEHQEMYGGGGYPQGLKGDEIHPYSHVVKIADVYDALTSKRPYKESIPSSKAIKIMLSEGEKSFHPDLLATFVQLSNYHDMNQPAALPAR